MAFVLLVQAAELAALVSRVTTSEKEVQEQKKEVTALREELDISKTEQQLTGNTLVELQSKIAGILIRDFKLVWLSLETNHLLIYYAIKKITKFQHLVPLLNVSIRCLQTLRSWLSLLVCPLQERLDHSIRKLHSSTPESSQTLAGLTTQLQVCITINFLILPNRQTKLTSLIFYCCRYLHSTCQRSLLFQIHCLQQQERRVDGSEFIPW